MIIKIENEWIGKSISERREWYYKELGRLFDYLVEEESYRDAGKMLDSREALENIKNRMKIDQKAGSDTTVTGEEIKEYYQAVDLAYRELPESDRDTDELLSKLGRAMEIFVNLK